MLKSENARPIGLGLRGRARARPGVGGADLRAAVARQVKLEPAAACRSPGQFEYLERANARLKIVVPATLLIIFVLLVPDLPPRRRGVLIMATLPFALTGGVWFLWAMGYHLSSPPAWASSRWPAWRPSSAW